MWHRALTSQMDWSRIVCLLASFWITRENPSDPRLAPAAVARARTAYIFLRTELLTAIVSCSIVITGFGRDKDEALNFDDVFHPPLDGSLFLPEMVEFNAKHNPTHPFYVFYDEQAGNISHVSHLEFHHACQRVAHAVRPDRRGPDDVIIAIIANCDTILYQALMMGVIYAGFIPFPMSPRNSSAAVASMMRKTGCYRLIATQDSLGMLLDGIRTELRSHSDGVIDVEIEEPPAIAYVYPELGKETMSTPFVPYPKATERPVNEAVMYYLHSSGSTGFPKPIPITYLSAVHWCITPSVLEHVDFPTDIRICAASLPPFHTLGLYVQLFYPIASLKSVALYAPTSYHNPTLGAVIPDTQNTIETIQRTKSTALVVVPAFLEGWANSPDAIQTISKLEYVAFAGGPLAKKTGDALVAAGVRLSCVYGTTEFSAITYTFRNPTEQVLWEWVRFGPNQHIRWAAQGDGTYECQVLTCPTHQVSVENLPDVKGYASSDAFIKHPTIEGLYKVVGRLDDVLVHSSGEKTVPAPMETVIGASPFLSGVCMFGRARNQTGVLVEPRPEYAIDVADDEQVAGFRNKIWRDVEEANREAPAFSRIFKEMILVTSKDKPMLRAGKGTVIKKATMALYTPEIDALYVSVEASANAGIDVPLPAAWGQTEVEGWLMLHAAAVNAGKPVQVDVDVFEQGFDSLSSTFLRNRILGSLGASPRKEVREATTRISQNAVFANPTLRRLASYLIHRVAAENTSPSTVPDARTEIENMITKYAVGLGDQTPDDAAKSVNGFHHRHVVLLTGSTGGLGSYLLAALLTHEDVTLVYAFNRPSKRGTIRRRQRAAFDDRGLDTAPLDSEKLVYIEGDAAQPNLSLDAGTYAEIRDSVTVIIHNAWRLDFNLALSSFESNVRGTRHLIDLARASGRAPKPRFMFTSSIASAQGWDKSRGAFPEEVQLDAGVAVGLGYGASKYVSERLLAMSGLPATSFRIGQITGGAPRGAWSTTDWVPIIIKSSVTLGALPGARGVTSWLPPHAVSGAILDVAFADEAPPLAVNLVHPRPIPWGSLMRPIGEALYQKQLTSSLLPLVPFSEWVTRLNERAADASEANLAQVPAIKLLDFMRELAKGDIAMRDRTVSDAQLEPLADEAVGFTPFMTEVAQRVSKTMRALEPLSTRDVGRWVDYWVSVGMF